MSLKVEKKDAAKAHSGANKTQSRRYPLAPLSNNLSLIHISEPTRP